jgi:hypothetical protein
MREPVTHRVPTSNPFRFWAIRLYLALVPMAITMWLLLFGTRAGAASASGEGQSAEQGLSVSLTADEDVVSMGDTVEFLLRFHFDPDAGGSGPRFLDRYVRAWECAVTFIDEESGAAFEREPYDVGMPVMPWPADIVELAKVDSVSEALVIHLLSDDGEQVPVGRYSAIASYENHGLVEGRSVAKGSSDDFWRGRIESTAWKLEVLPAADTHVELELPDAIEITPLEGRASWSWERTGTTNIDFRQRPGYTLGWQTVCRVVVAEREVDAGSSLNSSGMPSGGYVNTEAFALLRSDKEARLVVDVELFETSVPTRHMWMPRRGDYKVLWRGRMAGQLE